MTAAEKLDMVKTLLGLEGLDEAEQEAEDKRISVYLCAAAKEIISWRFSYSDRFRYSQDVADTVPPEYEMTQVFAVVAGYSQRGAENQTSHSENGISRTFQHSDMVAYIRRNVIPLAGIV